MFLTVHNTAEIRSLNKKKILEYLRSNKPATKKEIAQALDLSFATVSNLCNQLGAEGIFKTLSSNCSSGGRIPELLSLDPASRYSVCYNVIDNGFADAAILNLKNEIIAFKKTEIPETVPFSDLVRIYRRIFDVITEENAVDLNKIIGAGIAVPGIYNRDTGLIVNSTRPVFEGMPLREKIEEALGIPCQVENDTNLMALAVSKNMNCNYGDARSVRCNDLIYLYIGEGLGIGLICGGKLLTGSHGLASEVSHINAGFRDYECYCGKKGCIETELSMSGFLKKFYEKSSLGNPDKICADWSKFEEAALQHEDAAMCVVEENGRLAGRILALLANLLDPGAIYIGGITENIFSLLYPFIRQEFDDRLLAKQYRNIEIYNSRNYENLIFQGCGELAVSAWRP